MNDERLRYPIGRFDPGAAVLPEQVPGFIDAIEALPRELRALVEPLDDADLARRYRPGGWTVAQVVHHLADSHVNSYVRFRLALTEDRPTIRPYDEAAWADLPDAREADVAVSLALIEALHARWVRLLRAMSPADFERDFDHPESGRIVLRANTGLYAWHGRHHLAHIRMALGRAGNGGHG